MTSKRQQLAKRRPQQGHNAHMYAKLHSFVCACSREMTYSEFYIVRELISAIFFSMFCG